VTTALKTVPQQEFQKCFHQWQAASLGWVHSCWRGVLWRWLFSVSREYTCTIAIKSFKNFTATPHISVLCGSLSPWHGLSLGCRWRVVVTILNKQLQMAN